VNVLAISGSLREQSFNSAVARAAAELAPPGVEVSVFRGLAELPLYDADLDAEGEEPSAVSHLRESIAAADALFVVTPEYNGSVPGVLKNAIDWASRPAGGGAVLWAKTVAIAGATTGQYGALWAQQDLRRILGIAGARVVDGELPIARAQNVVDETGHLRDALVVERLRRHLETLVHEAAVPVAA
jgi:chromate reductase